MIKYIATRFPSFLECLLTKGKDELVKKLTRKDEMESKGMKVNINKTQVKISGESCRGFRILEDGHLTFVVEVLVET